MEVEEEDWKSVSFVAKKSWPLLPTLHYCIAATNFAFYSCCKVGPTELEDERTEDSRGSLSISISVLLWVLFLRSAAEAANVVDRRVEFEVGFGRRAIVVQIGGEHCFAFRGKWSPDSPLTQVRDSLIETGLQSVRPSDGGGGDCEFPLSTV